MSTARILSAEELYQITMSDTAGDTPLHTLIRGCHSAHEVAEWLKESKTEALENVAKKINVSGLLPIDLIKSLTIAQSEKQKLYNLFLPLTKKNLYSITKMSGIKEIAETKEPVHRNIIVAYNIIKFTRSIITASSTHPECNTYSEEKMTEIIEKIERLREEYADLQEIISEKSRDEVTDKEKVALLALVETQCRKRGVGNCLEFSYLGLAYLLKAVPGIRGEIYRIGQGDHWFLVLGRHPRSDENKPETWGDSAIVCDPFIGEAYPAKQLYSRLKNYREIAIPGFPKINCLVPFNPKKQYVEPWMSCNPRMVPIKSKGKYVQKRKFADPQNDAYLAGGNKKQK